MYGKSVKVGKYTSHPMNPMSWVYAIGPTAKVERAARQMRGTFRYDLTFSQPKVPKPAKSAQSAPIIWDHFLGFQFGIPKEVYKFFQ